LDLRKGCGVDRVRIRGGRLDGYGFWCSVLNCEAIAITRTAHTTPSPARVSRFFALSVSFIGFTSFSKAAGLVFSTTPYYRIFLMSMVNLKTVKIKAYILPAP
jgi:hypothetical protein